MIPSSHIAAAISEVEAALTEVTSPRVRQTLFRVHQQLTLAGTLLGASSFDAQGTQTVERPPQATAAEEPKTSTIKPRLASPAEARVAYVYCGVVPPWDDSLGSYREFTSTERADPRICRPLATEEADSHE